MLWIKKPFKSIDFDLAKHALISPPPRTRPCTGWVNFDQLGSYEITIYVFTVVIMYSYLFDTAPCNSFRYSCLRVTKMLLLLFLARKPYDIPLEKMARKDVKEESNYHGIGEMSITV